jgi:hypothetical protein
MLRITPILALLAAIAVAGCGGSNKPPKNSASVGGNPDKGPGAAAYRYADCMRQHGVSAFQDPVVHTNGNQVSVTMHVDPQMTRSPDYKSALTACAHFLPNGGNGPTPAQQQAREQDMLAFANCMRKHGFSRFPDPTAQGNLTIAMIEAAGINLKAPAVKPAADACVSVTHGILTKAAVAQAVANPNGSGHQQSAAGGGG